MRLLFRQSTGPGRAWAALLALACATGHADDGTAPERFSLHAQATHVTQWQSAFRSPYQGDNSLLPQRQQQGTNDITLYLGARLWPGAEVYANPEIDQGFGLSNTLGAAGFPSGEAYKVGKSTPYLRLNRLFLRQVVALAGEQQAVEPAANALAGPQPVNNLTFTIGKFSVADLFDGNSVAHDPRVDFLNWSIIDAGAFDYAADAWGFTHGAAAEWTQGDWTLRGGLFALSTHPNSADIDKTFGQHAWIAELARRYTLAGQPGQARLLWYVNHGRMGRYADAAQQAQASGSVADLAAVRQRGSKSGWALNMEQSLTPDVSGFFRYSASDGSQEAFDFTEINRSVSGGVVLGGALWGQPQHTLGLGTAVNRLSAAGQAYFNAGGIGILIGDGRLPHPGSEQIAEAFYAVKLGRFVRVSADAQRIVNPAYNRDRGPVNILGLRVHAEF